MTPPPPPSPEWQVLYSPGAAPLVKVDGGWCITFVNPIHYVVLGYQGAVSKEISGELDIQGTDFYATEGASGPKARFYLQRRGDNMSGQGDYQYYRWWSNPLHVRLTTGKVRLTVPLEPDQWSSVFAAFGNENVEQFKSALDSLQAVGLTFGGDFAGHGVGSHSKSGRVCLRNFTVR